MLEVRIISFMQDITIMCNIYNLHVLIDINYIKCHYNVFYMSTSIMKYYWYILLV